MIWGYMRLWPAQFFVYEFSVFHHLMPADHCISPKKISLKIFRWCWMKSLFTCSYRKCEISSCTEFVNQIIAEPINDNADFIKCTSRLWWSSALMGARNICGHVGWSLGLKGYDDKVIDCPYCRRYLSVCTLYFSCSLLLNILPFRR